MIHLALDASETRATQSLPVRRGRVSGLRIVLFGVAGAGALGGFAFAASSLMAGLAAPAPTKFVASNRAAEWPDLKDGLPALAGSGSSAPQPVQPAQAAKPADAALPVVRMAGLPDTATAFAPRVKDVAPTPPPVQAAAPAQSPTRRIPVPTPVTPVATVKQVVPLPPTRTVALQAPRAAETVHARETAQTVATPKPVTAPKPVIAPKPVAATPSAGQPQKTEKPAHKALAANKGPDKAKGTTAVAQADTPEETEVLGIKLPSLAPAGRKLKESVDALGEAVKSVF